MKTNQKLTGLLIQTHRKNSTGPYSRRKYVFLNATSPNAIAKNIQHVQLSLVVVLKTITYDEWKE